jgi:hypothetical protein
LRYNPSKIDEIDYLLKKYTDNEELLLERMFKKYDVSVSDFYKTVIESLVGKKSIYTSRKESNLFEVIIVTTFYLSIVISTFLEIYEVYK